MEDSTRLDKTTEQFERDTWGRGSNLEECGGAGEQTLGSLGYLGQGRILKMVENLYRVGEEIGNGRRCTPVKWVGARGRGLDRTVGPKGQRRRWGLCRWDLSLGEKVMRNGAGFECVLGVSKTKRSKVTGLSYWKDPASGD